MQPTSELGSLDSTYPQGVVAVVIRSVPSQLVYPASYNRSDTSLPDTAMASRKGPFKLVTVNTAPERARRLIGRLIEALKDEYDIIHADNCESMN